MKYFISLSLAFIFSGFSQTVQSQVFFQGAYGTEFVEQGYSIFSASDETIVSASLTTSEGGANVMLTKTGMGGQTIWSQVYGGDSGDFVHQAQETSDGGFIMTGWTASYGAGDDDVLLVKTNSAGSVEWAKAYGKDDSDRGRAVRETSDGGYVILGHTDGFGLSFNDIYLIKTDALGDTSWVKTYGGVNASGENGWWIEQTSDGGFIATGNTTSGPGFTNMLLAKFDAAGDTTWTRSFGGAGGQCGGYCVKETSNGDFICTGWTNAFGAGDSDVYTVLTDQNGDLIWSKTYGGNDGEGSQGIVETDSGGFIVAASTSSFGLTPNSGSNGFALSLSQTGDTLWTKVFGGELDDRIYAVAKQQDEGYLLAGWMRQIDEGSDELLIVKFHDQGNICDAVGTSTIVGDAITEVGTTELGLSQIPTQTSVTDVSFSINTEVLINDSIYCSGVIANVSNKEEIDLVKIFPNPSAGEFTLDLTQIPESVQISILNIEGEKVSGEKLIGGGLSTLDLDLPVGMYFVKYHSEKYQGVKRVVIVNN